MIIVGGFGFVLLFCLTPYIIKGGKFVGNCFLAFIGLAFLSYVFAYFMVLLPYILKFIGFSLLVFLAFAIRNITKENQEKVKGEAAKSKNEKRWNAKKEIAKKRLLVSGEEVTKYNIVMGAYEVTSEEADEFIVKEQNEQIS